jgi:fluoroacetyl-CoA thioesterase
MIQFIEELCTDIAAPHLEEDETTVGVHVDIYHRSAAREGDEVLFRSMLESVEGRRLGFSVTAHCGTRVVGEGRHVRVVVDRNRFSVPPTA